jgi:hypothetical protein
LLALVSLYRDAFPEACRLRGRDVDGALAALHPSAPEWWSRATENEELADLGRQALAAAPTLEEVEAAVPRAAAWSRVVELLNAGLVRAEAVLDGRREDPR